jgi:hypothetical protein
VFSFGKRGVVLACKKAKVELLTKRSDARFYRAGKFILEYVEHFYEETSADVSLKRLDENYESTVKTSKVLMNLLPCLWIKKFNRKETRRYVEKNCTG